MKRVSRILFNMVTLLSLVLCLTTVVLWIRSDFVADVIERRERQIRADGNREWTFLRVVSERERLRATVVRTFDEYPASGPAGPFWSWTHEVRQRVGLPREASIYHNTAWTRAGLILAAPTGYLGSQIESAWIVGVPHWLPVGLFAIVPLIRVVRAIRRHRKRPGLCLFCGYDLRATPDRCPECGTIPA